MLIIANDGRAGKMYQSSNRFADNVFAYYRSKLFVRKNVVARSLKGRTLTLFWSTRRVKCVVIEVFNYGMLFETTDA